MYRIVYRATLAPRDIRAAIKRERMKQVRAQAEKILQVTCPEHGRPAEVTLVKGTLEVKVCCEALEAAIRKVMDPD